MKKLVIVGAGNLGYHLALRLHQFFNLSVINHRHNDITEELSNLKIPTIIDINNLPDDADVYIFCVKDHLIKDLTHSLFNKISASSVVLHTSGAVDSIILNHFSNFGVLYPLYSFTVSDKSLNWNNIPLFIIANNSYTQQTIKEIANHLNPDLIHFVDDATKLHLHLLAVMSNNFTNALLHSVYSICHKKNNLQQFYPYFIQFAISTIQRTHQKNPALFQTGPAIRQDHSSIEKHLQVLNEFPEIKNLYLAFNHYIQNCINNEIKQK